MDRLAEEFLARLRRGERPSVSEYVERHPDLADDIRDVFPPLLLMEEAARPASADRDAAPRPLPSQLGEYRILREVGRGGMGVVYEAEQVTLGRHVALKVLPRRAGDERLLDRFRHEARAAARLHHTNIVPVFGVGEHQGTHYYAMQFIQGRGLDEVVLELRKLRESGAPLAAALLGIGEPTAYYRSVARIGLQVSEALAYAHKQGVLHRDIKPSNLLLDAKGTVWVTDFGLAKEEGTDQLTQTGDIVGTIVYMAPERFHGWADPRSDVYSLGLTLYEMLVLRPAFSDTNYQRLLKKVLEEEPPPLRRSDATIPRDLETIVMKAIAKEPAQRYRSANQLSKDLDRFLSDEPIRARRPTFGERVALWARRSPAAVALVAVVLFSLAATAGGLAWHNARLAEQIEAKEDALRRVRALGLVYASAATQEADPLRALRLAVEASEADLTPESEARLREARALSLHRHVLRGHERRILAARFAPAGDLAVTASQDGTARLWDLDGREVTALRGHEGAVADASFSGDGSLVLTRGADRAVRVWSRAGEALARLAHDTDVTEARFAGARVWTRTSEGTLRVWDPAGPEIARFPGPGPHQVSSRGRVIAIEGALVRMCDLDGRELCAVSHSRPVDLAVVSRQEERLLTAAGADVRLWDQRGRELAALPGHAAGIHCAAFSPTGARIATVPKLERRFFLWDSEGRLIAESADPERFWGVLFSPDGTRLVAGTAGGGDLLLFDCDGVQISRFPKCTPMREEPPGPGDWWPTFSPDARMILCGPGIGGDTALWMRNADMSSFVRGNRRAEFSPTGNQILSHDGTCVTLWPAQGGTPRTRLVLPEGIDSFAWSPTGESILTTSPDGTASLWAAKVE